MITSQKFSDLTNYQERLNWISSINYKDFKPTYDNEKVFEVDLNKKTITIPSSQAEVAVLDDTEAETIWFAVPRYFDGHDLFEDNKKWCVHAVDAKQNEMLLPIRYKEWEAEKWEQIQFNGNKLPGILLGWPITRDITHTAGNVSIALRCFEIEKGKNIDDEYMITFSLGTKPAVIKVAQSYSIDTESIPDSEIENSVFPTHSIVTQMLTELINLYGTDGSPKISYENLGEKGMPSINGEVLTANAKITLPTFNDINEVKDILIPDINAIGERVTLIEDSIGIGEAEGEGPTLLERVAANEEDIKAIEEALGITEGDDSETSLLSRVETNEANIAENAKTIEANGNNISENTKAIEINAKAIEELNLKLEEMTFIPLSIQSFDNSLKLYEKNSVYNGPITFSWEISGNAKTLALYNSLGTKLKDLSVDSAKGSVEVEITDLKDTTEYKLLATDPRNNENEEFTSVIFTYKVFWGAVPAQETYTSDFISSLEGSSLQETKETTFSINAEAQDYVFFCAPKSYSLKSDSFVYGVTAGGFGLAPVATVIYNETEYEIWKSDHSGFGESTFKVV